MNKTKLTALCHKVSEKVGVSFNSVMLYYFLESILRKLAESKYSERFIFKGGFLLSSVVGIDSRSTVDIDLLLRNMKLSEETIVVIFNEVLKTNEAFIERWKAYSKKNIYAKDITFKEVVNNGIKLLEKIK